MWTGDLDRLAGHPAVPVDHLAPDPRGPGGDEVLLLQGGEEPLDAAEHLRLRKGAEELRGREVHELGVEQEAHLVLGGRLE